MFEARDRSPVRGEGVTDFLQFLVAGVAVGSLYALLALGFVIVYKATGVINFAHGGLLLHRHLPHLRAQGEAGPALLPRRAGGHGRLCRRWA